MNRHPVCASDELADGGPGVCFAVERHGISEAAFAVRFRGQVYAYLNRCSHVPMEMDYQPNRFFDLTGHWLICATHGATYSPRTGACRGGPCRSGLVKIETSERDGVVHWHTAQQLQNVNF